MTKKNDNFSENNKSINISITGTDSEINDFLYCWDLFKNRPNKIIIHNTYSTKLFNDTLSKHIIDRNLSTEIIPAEEDFIINDRILSKIDNNIYCSYLIIDRNHENSIISEVTFLYKDENDSGKIQELVSELNACILNFEENSNRLNTLVITQNGLEIEPIELVSSDVENSNFYYSKKTNKNIKKLIKEINNSTKGLSIIYGERGLGKTTALDYIASLLDRIVIFIPNNMIDLTINNPEFKTFVKRYERPVLVIDDCEMLFHEIFNKSNLFSNNLIQMVDGFISDSLEVNIITIFNIDDENEIDHTLLECNNLIMSVKFDEMSADESDILSSRLGFNKKHKNKMRVLDIIKNKKPTSINTIGL